MTNLPIPIPMEDPIIHTDAHPVCTDPSCPCHSQPYAIVQAGHPMLGMIGTITDVTPDGFLRLRIEHSSFSGYFRPGDLMAVLDDWKQAESVIYIATANERGQWLEVQVLASNATYPQTIGQYRTLEECKKAVEQFGQVTWVTPYRFQKEATCY